MEGTQYVFQGPISNQIMYIPKPMLKLIGSHKQRAELPK
uniref:Uncharacterized protein n=1 Tax=Rhizophora mucronata TaxID=61149 RepID=A0A2P2MQY1_RHIMU